MPDASYLRRVGYTFLGWSRKLGATEPDADLTYQDLDGDGIYETAPTGWRMPAEETILYAVWEAQWIPIIYDSNYPDVPHLDPDEWLVECSTTITLDAPKRDGYKLKGWAVTPDATDIDYKPGDKYDVLNWLSVLEDNGDGTFSEKLVNPNVLYAIWEPDGVTLVFWSYTDDHPIDDGQYVEVRRVTVQLTDLFDYTYDPNKDDDDTNNYLSHKVTGWYDEWWSEFYNQDWVNDFGYTSFDELTIQHIADMCGWDGVSDINVYAECELRQIKVTYVGNGYEDSNALEETVYVDWFSTPYLAGLKWSGYELVMQSDDYGYEIDATMTCETILRDLWEEPLTEEMTIYIDFSPLEYAVNYIFPNGVQNTLSHFFGDIITLPTTGLGFDYPGYDFVGWYTQPDGAGVQIIDITKYADIALYDIVTSIDIYAYFVPSIGGSSIASTSVLDEVVSSIQTASAPAPASGAAPVTRSLASAAQAASKPQNAVTAALQLASVQTATPSTLADATYAAPASALVASDATLAPSFYPVATNATCAYETIAKSTAKTTVCPAQTLQAALVGSKRREA